jgi:tetratricopeptide (TPR) repeat protein
MKKGSGFFVLSVTVLLALAMGTSATFARTSPEILLVDARRDAAQEIFAEAVDLYNQGNFSGAIERFEIGFKIDADNPVAHYYMAESLQKLKRDKDSFLHYRASARLGPNTKEGVIAQAKIDKYNEIITQQLDALEGWYGGRWLATKTDAKHGKTIEWDSYVSPLPVIFQFRPNQMSGALIYIRWGEETFSLISLDQIRDKSAYFSPENNSVAIRDSRTRMHFFPPKSTYKTSDEAEYEECGSLRWTMFGIGYVDNN